MTDDVRSVLIVDEDVAGDLQCIVDPREEEDLGFLLPRNGMVVWAALVVAGPTTWAAEVHQVRLSLSFLFQISVFCFYYSVLSLMFEFKFDFCFVLQVLKYFNIQTN